MPEPEKQPTVTDALRSERTIVIAPNEENAVQRVTDACTEALGGDASKLKASVVAQCRVGRFRKEDSIVLALIPPGAKPQLRGPISVGKHWDPERDSGMGGVVEQTFFAELARNALPMTIKRRSDVDMMTLGHA